jgi:hypothetical protein
MPFVFRPVEWEGKLYLDGGCVRNLPLDAYDYNREGGRGGSMLALSIRDRHEAKRKITNIALFTAQLLETMVYGPVRPALRRFKKGTCSVKYVLGDIYLISYFIK